MDPFADAPLLRLLLRGIKRTIGLSSRRRLPITMSVMRQLKGALADDLQIASQDKLMLWSAFTLAFFGFLRSSEFTSPSPTHFNPLVHLACSDISFTSDGSLVLQLKASKTDPFRMGCSITLAPSGRSVCAVRAMHHYLAHRPPGNSTPLYIFSSGQFLTRDKVTAILRLQLQHLGFATESYAPHSFRIGAATTAAEAGLPPWLIQTLGRWSSNCYTQYIRTPASILHTVPAQLAATHSTPLQAWDPSTGQCRPFQVVLVLSRDTWQYLGHNLGAHLPLSYRLRQAGWVPYPPSFSYLRVARLGGFLLWVSALSPHSFTWCVR